MKERRAAQPDLNQRRTRLARTNVTVGIISWSAKFATVFIISVVQILVTQFVLSCPQKSTRMQTKRFHYWSSLFFDGRCRGAWPHQTPTALSSILWHCQDYSDRPVNGCGRACPLVKEWLSLLKFCPLLSLQHVITIMNWDNFHGARTSAFEQLVQNFAILSFLDGTDVGHALFQLRRNRQTLWRLQSKQVECHAYVYS